MSKKNLLIGWFVLWLFLPGRSMGADIAVLSPLDCCDGRYQVVDIGGRTVWQNLSGNDYLYFDVPTTFTFSSGMSVYLKIRYYDSGYGTVEVQYDSTRGDSLPDIYSRSESHNRSSRVDSGVFVDSYHGGGYRRIISPGWPVGRTAVPISVSA